MGGGGGVKGNPQENLAYYPLLERKMSSLERQLSEGGPKDDIDTTTSFGHHPFGEAAELNHVLPGVTIS